MVSIPFHSIPSHVPAHAPLLLLRRKFLWWMETQQLQELRGRRWTHASSSWTTAWCTPPFLAAGNAARTHVFVYSCIHACFAGGKPSVNRGERPPFQTSESQHVSPSAFRACDLFSLLLSGSFQSHPTNAERDDEGNGRRTRFHASERTAAASKAVQLHQHPHPHPHPHPQHIYVYIFVLARITSIPARPCPREGRRLELGQA